MLFLAHSNELEPIDGLVARSGSPEKPRTGAWRFHAEVVSAKTARKKSGSKNLNKGPKKTAKETLTKGKVRIKQVRSGIGHSWRMRLTLEALGLKNHQAEVIHQDSPSLRGQIKHVRHLIEVTPIEE